MSELVICFSNYVCAQAPARTSSVWWTRGTLWTAWSRLVSPTSKSSDNLDLILLMHLSTDWSYSCSSVGTIFVASRACGVADTWRRYARSPTMGDGLPWSLKQTVSWPSHHRKLHCQQTNKQTNKETNQKTSKERKKTKLINETQPPKSNKRTNKPYTGNQNKCKHNTKQTNNKQTTRNTQTHKQN